MSKALGWGKVWLLQGSHGVSCGWCTEGRAVAGELALLSVIMNSTGPYLEAIITTLQTHRKITKFRYTFEGNWRVAGDPIQEAELWRGHIEELSYRGVMQSGVTESSFGIETARE